MLALYNAVSNADEVAVKTINGKLLPWSTHVPVSYSCQDRDTLFFNRVVLVFLNSKNEKYGCLPLSMGVILDKNRILTSYNPFKKLTRDSSIINEIHIYVLITLELKPGCLHTHQIHELWSGRQVTYTPDEDIPVYSWHGLGPNRRSPLHDLMILRVKTDFDKSFPFSKLKESQVTFGTKNQIFIMLIAKPGDKLTYPVRFAQINVDGGRKLQYYDDGSSDDIIVNCDSYITKLLGHFICIRNIYEKRGLSSGAVLVSNETVFGIGSFAIKRENDGILVFTDVRPYHDLIMNTMTDADTE